uniref:glutathione transferase n=1 Tax=Brachionus plicatilis TaxID=10195 RepID=A0A3G2JSG7_BRAPC|nr:glutathione S-transferase S6 [Brachionus plicatilis]
MLKFTAIAFILIVGYSCSEADYKLTYFDIRGRGEFIRFIFAAANHKFEDNRINPADWSNLKASTPFQQLPTLEIHEDSETVILAQSKAIARFLADRFGFNGENEIERALIDMYGCQLGDLFDSTVGKNLTNQQFDTILNQNFKFFEDRLNKNGSGFLVGGKISWADIFLSQMTEFLDKYKNMYLDKYPQVKALDEYVRDLPGVKEWIQNRPTTPF